MPTAATSNPASTSAQDNTSPTATPSHSDVPIAPTLLGSTSNHSLTGSTSASLPSQTSPLSHSATPNAATSNHASTSAPDNTSPNATPSHSAVPIAPTSTPASTSASVTATLTGSVQHLRYHTPVAQRGHPGKQKQRLFEKTNRLVTFERLPLNAKDILRLRWLVCPDTARDAVRKGYKIPRSDVRSNQVALCMCADERACISDIKQYFMEDAWENLSAEISAVDVNDTLCVVCCRRSGAGSNAVVKWIQCDGCLVWVHLHCTAHTRKPRGNWFCDVCQS